MLATVCLLVAFVLFCVSAVPSMPSQPLVSIGLAFLTLAFFISNSGLVLPR